MLCFWQQRAGSSLSHTSTTLPHSWNSEILRGYHTSKLKSLAKSTFVLTPLFGLLARSILKEGSSFNQRIKPLLSQQQDINLTSIVSRSIVFRLQQHDFNN